MGERERQVVEIARLAVAVPQPREDPRDLQVALHAGEVEPAEKLRSADVDETARDGAVVVGTDPAGDPILGPAHVDVAQQADEVVGDRTVHRVLEVDHSRVGCGIAPRIAPRRATRTPPRTAIPQVHEVTRVVVAMDEDPWLLDAGPDQRLEGVAERMRERPVELDTEVVREEPVREEMQLVEEPALVVRRHAAPADAALHGEQGVERIRVEGVGVGFLDHVEIADRSQIVEQQESAFHVRGVEPGRVDAGAAQQAEHRDERPAVLHRRRRVHRDPRPRARMHPEVAAEARILGCGLDPERGGPERIAQPRRERNGPPVESLPILHRSSLNCGSTAAVRRHRGVGHRSKRRRERLRPDPDPFLLDRVSEQPGQCAHGVDGGGSGCRSAAPAPPPRR